MFFGKKKKLDHENAADEADDVLRITTIPQSFYGGNDPVIYAGASRGSFAPASERIAEAAKKTPPPAPLPNLPAPVLAIQKPPFPPSNAPRAAKKMSMPTAKKSTTRTVLLVVLGLALVSLVGVGVWYVAFQDAPPPPKSLPITVPTVPSPIVSVVPTSTPALSENPAPETPETKTPTTSVSILFPSVLLADTVDTDKDTLTDLEEILFQTGADAWDSDDDGYFDGQEVINLYNPTGFAPVKLVDSGLIDEYVNPVWGYRIYYPSGWEVGSVDPNATHVLFSSISGDYVAVHTVDMPPTMTFQTWFVTYAKGEQFLSLVPFENRFQESGYRRKDRLVGYMVVDTHVFVIAYHPGISGSVPFRTTVDMMMQSFRPDRSDQSLPSQPILPSPPQFAPAKNTSTTSSTATSTTQESTATTNITTTTTSSTPF